MTAYGLIIPKSVSIYNWSCQVNGLTSKAKQRLKILDWHNKHEKNVSLTARRFGLSRYTVRI